MQHSSQENFYFSQNSEHSNPIVNTAYLACRTFLQCWRDFFICDQFSPHMKSKSRPFWYSFFIYFHFKSIWEIFLKIASFWKISLSQHFCRSRSRAILVSILCPFLGRSLPCRFTATCKRRWGVVQLVGHLTVNEDGDGSNPSAPANFLRNLVGVWWARPHERWLNFADHLYSASLLRLDSQGQQTTTIFAC